jgi:hypothetical protein
LEVLLLHTLDVDHLVFQKDAILQVISAQNRQHFVIARDDNFVLVIQLAEPRIELIDFVQLTVHREVT